MVETEPPPLAPRGGRKRRRRRRRPRQHQRRLPPLLVFAYALALPGTYLAAAGGGAGGRFPPAPRAAASPDPYEVLGVPRTADDAEIRRRYRKLCLRYHPDKNVGRTEEERRRCEEAFKKIQRANELVGDREARARHDREAAFAARMGGMGGGPGGGPAPATAEDLFRQAFYGAGAGAGMGAGGYYGRPRRRRPAFYVNGIDISDLFRQPAFAFGRQGEGAPEEVARSVFVQKVTVPLEDLYSGADATVLRVNDTPLARYRAAVRGGCVARAALQAAAAASPLLLRTSLPVTALAFAVAFHLGLPRPDRLLYPTRIGRGWKAGTKITYRSAPEEGGLTDVVFVLEEGEHSHFQREGDDLTTVIAVGEGEARRGCTLHIQPLGKADLPIIVKLSPGEVEGEGATKVVKGKGWPRRKDGGKGNLIVEIKLVADDEGGGSEVDGRRSREDGAGGSRRRRRRRKSNT